MMMKGLLAVRAFDLGMKMENAFFGAASLFWRVCFACLVCFLDVDECKRLSCHCGCSRDAQRAAMVHEQHQAVPLLRKLSSSLLASLFEAGGELH